MHENYWGLTANLFRNTIRSVFLIVILVFLGCSNLFRIPSEEGPARGLLTRVDEGGFEVRGENQQVWTFSLSPTAHVRPDDLRLRMLEGKTVTVYFRSEGDRKVAVEIKD